MAFCDGIVRLKIFDSQRDLSYGDRLSTYLHSASVMAPLRKWIVNNSKGNIWKKKTLAIVIFIGDTNKLLSRHEPSCSGNGRITSLLKPSRTAACKWATTAYVTTRSITPSKACVFVVVSLCSSNVSLPESAESKIIFSPRVSFARVTHSVSKISRIRKATPSNLTALPSIMATRNRAWAGAMLVVVVEADIAPSSQSRACRHFLVLNSGWREWSDKYDLYTI